MATVGMAETLTVSMKMSAKIGPAQAPLRSASETTYLRRESDEAEPTRAKT